MLPETINKLLIGIGITLIAVTFFIIYVSTSVIFGYYNINYALSNTVTSPVSILGYVLIGIAYFRGKVKKY